MKSAKGIFGFTSPRLSSAYRTSRPYRRSSMLLAQVFATALATCIALSSPEAQTVGPNGWIDTWSASPQPVWDADFFAPINIPRALRNQTIRQVARVSLGGSQVRVELSNTYGKQPLVIGEAHVALSGKGSAIEAGSTHKLTFGGQPSIVVPPGASI